MSHFLETINEIRLDYEIPIDGYTESELNKLKIDMSNNGNTYFQWKNQLEKEVLLESKQFAIPSILRSSLINIVLCNFIYLPLTRLFLERNGALVQDDTGYEIKIGIYGKVKKKQIFDFVESNWDLIQKEMLKFENEESTYISDRDNEIIEMHDKKNMKFKEISDYFTETKHDYSTNEDMIKKDYHRAKKKIAALQK